MGQGVAVGSGVASSSEAPSQGGATGTPPPSGPPAAAPAPGGTPAAPAAAPAPGSEPSPGAAPEGAAEAAAPVAAPPLPERPGPTLEEFREKRNAWSRELTAVKARLAETSQKLTTYEQQAQEIEALRTKGQSYDEFEALLNENPDLLDQLIERQNQRGGARRPGGAARTGEEAPLPPRLDKMISRFDKMMDTLEQQRVRTQQQQEQLETRRTEEKFRGALSTLLTQKGYDPDLLPLAESYVRDRIEALPDMPTAEDYWNEIPYLFAEFIAPMEKQRIGTQQRTAEGMRHDARGAVTPGGGAQPVRPAPVAHAMDETTTRLAEEFLKERGWDG